MKSRYLNPYTDFGFKKIFGEEGILYFSYTSEIVARVRGQKRYELSNHTSTKLSTGLGNVLAVPLAPIPIVGDRRLQSCDADELAYYEAEVVSVTDYYPFGMEIKERSWSVSSYRYGFGGQERDDEVSGSGNSIEYKYRIHDTRLGRFLSVDPLFRGYPWNSPYAFAENKVIQFIELEGAEIALPNIFPRIFVPRPTITIPRIPVPPTPPMVPVMPIPPQAIPQSPSAPVPQVPLSVPKMEINDIGWENPPNSPEDLGSDWEETTVPENTSGSRDFKNKKTSEEIRWDPARPGKGGHQEKNHWHRKNPNWDKSMKKNGKYLDKHGNPVDDGSGPSHIYTIRPVIIRPTSEQQVNHYNKKSKQYNVDLKRYNKAIKKYNRELKRYYKELEKNVEYT